MSPNAYRGGAVLTEVQSRGAELRADIANRTEDGRLPVLLSDSIRAGYGSGAKCAGCDQPVTADQIAYDVELARECDELLLTFHFICHGIWQAECATRIRKRRGDRTPIVTVGMVGADGIEPPTFAL
jgi:hypothetical protein